MTIAGELQPWLARRGITRARLSRHGKLPIGVRGPAEPYHGDVTSWHRDGCGKRLYDPQANPSTRWMVLWSNGTPTELRPEFQVEPFDVVLVDNVAVWHRTPPPEGNRWFARLLDPVLE